MFPIKNSLKRDALSPLLFNFPLEYAFRSVQVNQDGLKFNGAYQLLVYAYDANMLRGSVHTTKKNTEALSVASKETGLTVNGEETNCLVTSRDQNAECRRSHIIKLHNSAFELAEEFKYLGKSCNILKSYSGRN